jgi:hypothetical protein
VAVALVLVAVLDVNIITQQNRPFFGANPLSTFRFLHGFLFFLFSSMTVTPLSLFVIFACTADSSSRDAVSFSSARTTNRFPPQCTLTTVRPRKDKRGIDLISDVLPFGRLWYDTPDNAIGYAMHSSRSHAAVIRVCDAADNVTEKHEHKAIFRALAVNGP